MQLSLFWNFFFSFLHRPCPFILQFNSETLCLSSQRASLDAHLPLSVVKIIYDNNVTGFLIAVFKLSLASIRSIFMAQFDDIGNSSHDTHNYLVKSKTTFQTLRSNKELQQHLTNWQEEVFINMLQWTKISGSVFLFWFGVETLNFHQKCCFFTSRPTLTSSKQTALNQIEPTQTWLLSKRFEHSPLTSSLKVLIEWLADTANQEAKGLKWRWTRCQGSEVRTDQLVRKW